MTGDGWWQEPLQEWAETAGLNLNICEYTRAQRKREFGEWWLNSGRWNIHLDEHYYATVTPEPEVAVRRSLTWILSRLQQEQRPSPETLLTSWVENLLKLPTPALDRILVEGLEDPPEPEWFRVLGAGWLALLTPQYPKSVTFKERAELRQNMRHAVNGYTTDGFLGWLNLNASHEQGLVFIRDDVLEDEWNGTVAEMDEDEAPSVGTEMLQGSLTTGPLGGRSRATLVRRYGESLLDAVTQDVLLGCELSIGTHLANPSELTDAVLTLALLRGRQQLVDTGGKVLVWGERPLNILLQTVPVRGIDWFLKAVHPDEEDRSSRFLLPADERAPRLPEELISSLQGLVAANLNVSEAARLLFVHRNTLIHRIERIYELTGYDVRNFRDALVLWLFHSLTSVQAPSFVQSDSSD